MRLRFLQLKDAEPMLEWMHDASVVEKLQTDFSKKTLADCKEFILNSHNSENIHLAITDSNDNYMGTVSLKHISNFSAEFAITVCKDAMGKGYSKWAMNEILRIGFDEYALDYIYWCVATDNIRAIKFYDKNHFNKVSYKHINIVAGYTIEQVKTYIWYKVNRSEWCKK